MRARGINYDTGFLPGDQNSRKVFDAATVRDDLAVIRDELHCDAVRISGRDPDRLSVAARTAADAGLEVWFAPFPVDLSKEEMLPYFADCARRAEELRATGANVIFVSGCEVSLFGGGFVTGETYSDRMSKLADPNFWSALPTILEQLNEYLAEVAGTVRKHFGGQITYASGPWEFVDWTPFDIVGVDAYRATYNRDTFVDEVRGHLGHGKPVAVTEFGTCAYRGAGDLGGMAWRPPADAVPDEGEQVRYFTELMDVFEEVGIDTALWFTFAAFNLVGAQDDLSSYGVVRMVDATHWERKQVFAAIADRYGKQR